MKSEGKKFSPLLLRFAIGIPFGVLAVWFFAFGNLSLFYFVMIGTWIALREFWNLLGIDRDRQLTLALFGEVATIILLYLAWAHPEIRLDVIIIAWFLPVLFLVQLFKKARFNANFVKEVSGVLFGIVYIGGFMSFLFKLKHLETQLLNNGAISFEKGIFDEPIMSHLTIFPIVCSWCCDTAAFFSGRFFGRGKLAPSISPNKTVVGLAGGMIGSGSGVAAYAWSIGILEYIPLWILILFGMLAGALSQMGDLTVSAFKREAGVKDTGRILGAHGGMLDRIDGFLWSLPVSYLFLSVFIR